ncbi:NAD(P)-binding protein [Dichomitus squalens LYAD-421 SS1]|uniref:NAD(P)-binding protein n=1 Tax=Dichomitus squalens (strain LYAD-421) TaxID=732165 RepID=R7ST90_DICSQ|nr:NAD(P)-binding protein [Dichomitus squalens LYAD-421 SS1]EJF58970.1 NAD(P)-binding protein [Dichomitus squalens LYAD-421 SS1]
MSSKITIFYIGATGYIGGSVLQAILAHPKADTFEVTALVRNETKAKAIEKALGIKTVLGSLEDDALLTEYSEKADVVFQNASANAFDATKAILAGLKQRFDKTGKKPLFFHTWGIAVLVDNALGEYLSPTVTSDYDLDTIDKLPKTIINSRVDKLLVEADADGYTTTFIIAPAIIYGRPRGPLFDGPAPISALVTGVVTRWAAAAARKGRPGIIGKGANAWGYVHIDDNADAYYRLFDAALFGSAQVSHGREGYFWIEATEHTAYEVHKVIGEALVALGVIGEAEPAALTADEQVKFYGSEEYAAFFAANTRSKGDRLRKELGWAPKHTAQEEFIKDIKEDTEVAAKALKA